MLNKPNSNVNLRLHDEETLSCLSSVAFWVPDLINASAWLEHAPFAFWLVSVTDPKTIVELGTHTGYSYFAFCQAVQQLNLSTRCYAIDTWKGDEHAGFYGEDVFESVNTHNKRYAGFSQLIRSTFDDALEYFLDKSIDILHIDGTHFYEDIKHDFEKWLPKLSDRAVVLFHDTNVKERKFGIFKYWDELRHSYPHFEFIHGHGLGVLGVGKSLPPALHSLFNTNQTADILAMYSRLGGALRDRYHLMYASEQVKAIDETRAQLASELSQLSSQLSQQSSQLLLVTEENKYYQNELTFLKNQLAQSQEREKNFESNLNSKSQELDQLRNKLSGLSTALEVRNTAIENLNRILMNIYSSKSWRFSSRLQKFGARISRLFNKS